MLAGESENNNYMEIQPNFKKLIISGGGTGGHVFPAIAIADTMKRMVKDIEILFVGANNRLEMEKVPEAGYNIIGLPVEGIQRKFTFRNFRVLLKLINSLYIAKQIIEKFNPDAVVGVGGYASGPVLRAAAKKGIPTLIQEQNSYPGITNRILARKVKKICISYMGMEKYFPVDKMVLTGNPVREEIMEINKPGKKEEGQVYFKLDSNTKTLLVLGGSLGARTINQSVVRHLQMIGGSPVQILWQCGKSYYQDIQKAITRTSVGNIILKEFISNMDLAYAAADVIISRAGAITISELCFAGRPVILVPSPNVAEDHQTKNAMALVRMSAAIHVKDNEAEEKLIPLALKLLNDPDKMKRMSENILKMAVHDSSGKIAREIISLMN